MELPAGPSPLDLGEAKREDAPRWPGLRAFAGNLGAGLRFSLFRRVGMEEFHPTLDQLVLLLGANLALGGLIDWLLTAAPRELHLPGLQTRGLMIAVLLVAAYAIARTLRDPAMPLPLLVVFCSMGPLARVGIGAIDWLSRAGLGTLMRHPWLGAFAWSYMLWAYWIAYRAIRLVAGSESRRTFAAYLVYLAITVPPALMPREHLWQTRDDAETEDEDAAPERVAGVTWERGEDVLEAQRGLLRTQAGGLLPGRPGVVDLYFVGFASYADQDVFLKEIRYARRLFDDRFDARGRSLLLVDHSETEDSLPIASVTNLRAALRSVGRSMNPGEDILVLFLASHGQRGALAIRNGALPLKDLTPVELADALQESSIRWRVVIVDACYSGSFVEALRNSNTMVITSASSTHTSLGCGNEDEMTYFGKAFLRHGLSRNDSFAGSYQEASSLIRAWETRDGASHSEPQIFIGSAIGARLAAFGDRLERSRTTERRR